MQPGPFVPPPPAFGRHEIRPALWWFAVAGALALAGVVGAVVIWVSGVSRFTDTVDGFTRVEVPGTGEVTIDEPGGYSVYLERPGISDVPSASTPVVTVTAPSGGDVALRPYTSSVTYALGNHEGRGIFTFRAPEAGTYTVTTTGEPTSEVAIGRGIGRGLVSSIVGGFAVGAAGVIGGIVIAIVVGVRRGRSRRLLAAGRAPVGPPGGWGAPPGSGWGPPAPGGWGVPPAPPGAPPPPPGPPPSGGGGWAG